MEPSVVILAAGAGTRMKSKTPKVLHKICGKEQLFFVINEAKKISSDITVVLYHEAEMVKSAMEGYFNDINFVIQNHKEFPGTGGAMMGISPKNQKVLVLNGDMPLIEASELESFLKCEGDIVMSVIELHNPSGYGRVLIDGARVMKIIEEKDATSAQKSIKSVNAGVYLFDKSILETYLPMLTNNNAQKEYYLTDVIELAVNDKREVAPLIVKEENFKGVNSKSDLAHAEEIMLNRIRQKWMKAGVSMRLPHTIYIEHDVEFVGECFLENGVSIIGKSKIENSHIKTNSIVESSYIKDSDIGPMARVRPDSEVVSTHIGNFVELKKAKLTGVKAGHLSYLGDCEIDSGTNIGAGTITCNYDGKAKHKTKIGKNVFVGSDTQFVAPITIEDNVLIAAGTTVTKDIKSGELAISRIPQINKQGFFQKFFKTPKV